MYIEFFKLISKWILHILAGISPSLFSLSVALIAKKHPLEECGLNYLREDHTDSAKRAAGMSLYRKKEKPLWPALRWRGFLYELM